MRTHYRLMQKRKIYTKRDGQILLFLARYATHLPPEYAGRKKIFMASKRTPLGALSADSARQLDILGHDRHALGVNRAQVGVFEKTHQVRLRRFLQRANSGRLESQIRLEILSDLSDETLEGQLADQQLSRFLVSSDLTQSDGSWPVTMGFLDTPGGRGALSGSFGGQLLPRGLASGRLTGRLLGTRHFLLFDFLRRYFDGRKLNWAKTFF